MKCLISDNYASLLVVSVDMLFCSGCCRMRFVALTTVISVNDVIHVERKVLRVFTPHTQNSFLVTRMYWWFFVGSGQGVTTVSFGRASGKEPLQLG